MRTEAIHNHTPQNTQILPVVEWSGYMLYVTGLNPAGESGRRYRVGSAFRMIRDGAGETETADNQRQSGGELTKQHPGGRVGEGMRVNCGGNLPAGRVPALIFRQLKYQLNIMFIIGKVLRSAVMQCGLQYAPFGALPYLCVRSVGIIAPSFYHCLIA